MNAARRISFCAVALLLAIPTFLLSQPPAKKDSHGDPLPDGAVKRLGSMRLQHLRPVRQVAFTPDGKQLISLGEDFVCAVWDIATGKEIRRESWGDPKVPLDTHLANERIAMMLLGRAEAGLARQINASLSADGKHLLMCRDEKLRVLEAATGRQVAETTFKIGKTAALELSPDGKSVARFAVLQDYDPELSIVELATGKQLHKFRNPNRYYVGMRFSADGTHFAARDNGNNISLWDLAKGKRIRLYEGHEGSITGLTFVPGAIKLASAATDGVWLWDRTSDDPLVKFPLDDINICAAAFSANGKILATTGKQNSIYLWDVAAANQIRALAGHTGQVTTLAFSPDGKTLASGASDGTLRIWDASDGRELTPCKHMPRLQPISLIKRGVILAQVESSTTLHHVSETTGEIAATFPGPTIPNAGIAIAPNGKYLAVVDAESPLVKLWNVPENREACRLEGHAGRVNRIVFSANSEQLATLCWQDRTLRIWSPRDGKTLHKFDLPITQNEELQLAFRGRVAMPQMSNEFQIQDIAFAPDGRTVLCVGQDGLAYQWELASGKLRSRISLGSRYVTQLLYSPSARHFAAITNDDTLRVCDAVEGKLVHGFVGRDGDIRSIAFSPDSRLLAAGCVNGKIVLYDVNAGKEKRTFNGHQNAVQRLWFVDNGKTLMSASSDGSLLYWDVNAAPRAIESDKTPDAARLEALWTRLSHSDATEAFDAVSELARTPQEAIKFLRSKLEPTPAVAPERVKQLLSNLDSANFVVREKATEELTRCADQALPMLKKALRESNSTELSRRLNEIMEKTNDKRTSPHNLRQARVVELLERIGNAEAVALLQLLAGGAPDAFLTDAARDAVQRLQAAQ